MYRPVTFNLVRFCVRVALASSVGVLAGCGIGKSASPLSPSVAGGIAGVTISAPRLVEPAAGATLVATSGPVTFVVENAVSTGVRPLSHEFELGEDAGFTRIVLSRTVPAGADGRTRVEVLDGLVARQTYHWRARAVDGVNTGAHSEVRQFTLIEAIPEPPRAPAPTQGSGMPTINEGTAMVAWVIDDLRRQGISTSGDCGAFAITKRVAWAFRGRGAGLERKTAGRRCEDSSIDIVLFNDGQSVDILVGGGDVNGPAWQVHAPYSGWQSYWVAPWDPDR
jgi:hypothetical protein